MIAGPDELRRAFDAAFASAPPPPQTPARRYLVVSAAGRALALRLDEVRAVLPLPALAAVPRGRAGLLGVGAVRGRAAAVFALSALLGGDTRPCRWLAVIGGTLALALEELDGIAEAEAELPAPGGRTPFSTCAIARATATLDVVDLGALATALAPATAGGHPS